MKTISRAVLIAFLAFAPTFVHGQTIASLLEQVEALRAQIAELKKFGAGTVDLKIAISNAAESSVVITPTIAVAPRPQGVAYWNLTAKCESGLRVEFAKGLNFCRGSGLFRVSESTIGKKGSDHAITSGVLSNSSQTARVATFVLTAYGANGTALGTDTVRVTVGGAR